ncbi:MAG TPA: hypothetical protein VHT93_10040 [Pseudolabrys sp.]|nr:hypothetical protein [Pseudolabrys sp.]
MREGSFIYTQLIALNALRGYDDFHVIGAYITAPETIHGRTPINSIDDLKGKRIRVGNQNENGKFEILGAIRFRCPSIKLPKPSVVEPSTPPRFR